MFDEPGDDDDTPVTNVLGVSASLPLSSNGFEECVYCGKDRQTILNEIVL